MAKAGEERSFLSILPTEIGSRKMSAKEIRFSVDARDRTSRGIDILNNAVKDDARPKGRNVVLDKSYGLLVSPASA